ncbi:MAG: FtsX-like permease family protein [Ignavibacteria bacterium]|nr:FtsX-like permease family protein [Ignavibacteria bacterium]
MLFFESIKLAYNSIRTSKLRSILTLLGIAVGLFSIIIVMTSISAIQQSVENTFNSLGSNNFIVQKWPAIQMGGPHRPREFRNRKDLEVKEGEKLREMASLPVAIGIGLQTGGKTIRYENEKTNPNVTVAGVNFDYFIALDLKIGEGRNFSKSDNDYSKPVAVVGTDVVDKLFKGIDPIGRTIRINQFSYEIIGVFAKRGSVLGQSQDNFICVPLSVFEKHFGSDRSAVFFIMAKNKELINATMDEVIGALRKIRKVPAGLENDFEIITNDQLIEQFNDITKYFKLGAGVVAFIALLAAGIGIMNIMLVSVTERTKEIGIRKAIGARKQNILTQFIIEAVALSWFGGLIGIFLGLLGGNLVAIVLGVSVVLPVEWIVIGLLVTSFVGIVFGVYPAYKAANLDPIEALRYE